MSAAQRQLSLLLVDAEAWNRTWIRADEAARLMGLTPRQGPRLGAKYLPRKLATVELPPEGGSRRVWWLARAIDPCLRLGAAPPEESQREVLVSKYHGHKVDRAGQKIHWLNAWRNMCREGRLTREECAKVIIRQAKEKSKDEPFKITYRSLRDWDLKYKRGGVEALVPKQGIVETEPTRSPEAVEYFYESYSVTRG